jgi:hypothetical protein
VRNVRLKNKNAPAFKPPLPNRGVLWLGEHLIRTPGLRLYNVRDVVYPVKAELERLRQLKDERVVLVPNHPAKSDGVVLFDLSRRADQLFHIVTNRESFDDCCGMFGWWLQRIGCYSILRGSTDLASFNTTLQLLQEGPGKIVIFPEGGNYCRHGLVSPFQDAVIHTFRHCLFTMRRAGPPPLFIQPVALKYTCLRDATREIDASLFGLERELDISSKGMPDRYTRVMRICLEVLRSVEIANHIEWKGEPSLDDRLNASREAMMRRVESACGYRPEPSAARPEPHQNKDVSPRGHERDAPEGLSGGTPALDHEERTRAIINKFYKVSRTDALPGHSFGKSLFEDERKRNNLLRRDIERLANWLSVHDEGYIREAPTDDRYIDMLARLEIEVFHERRISPPVLCTVRLAEPFDLGGLMADYEQQKESRIKGARGKGEFDRMATLRIEAAIRELLE